VVHRPTALPEFFGHAGPAIARKLQGDALDGIPQIQISIRFWRVGRKRYKLARLTPAKAHICLRLKASARSLWFGFAGR